MKVIYEKHPVTPERKQQLRSQGYTIIDARFAPKGYVHPDANTSGDASGNAAAVDVADAHGAPTHDAVQDQVAAHQDDDSQSAAGDNLEGMTLDELKELAKELGVKVHANSGADKFIEAIRAADNAGVTE